MEIRKLFKFEMAHVVRNAWSKRCARNIHGHSYKLEVFLDSKTGKLDQAGMIVDFGLIKKTFNGFIDAFDHSFMAWNNGDDDELISFVVSNFDRVIVSTIPTSAESQAYMFFSVFEVLLEEMRKSGEVDPNVFIASVRVHETDTGFAEFGAWCDRTDGFYSEPFSLTFTEELFENMPEEIKDVCSTFIMHGTILYSFSAVPK